MRIFWRLLRWLLVIISAAPLIMYLSIMIFFALAPWDAAIIRPEVGTWQRTLNDFFDSNLGMILIYTTITIAIGWPLLRTLWHQSRTALRLMIANLLALFGGGVVLQLFGTIYYTVFPINTPVIPQRGYHLSVIPLLLIAIIYALWLREVRSLRQHSHKSKRKLTHTQAEPLSTAHHRLQADDPQTLHEALLNNSPQRLASSQLDGTQ